jgi:excisionase family DNA binding protein
VLLKGCFEVKYPMWRENPATVLKEVTMATRTQDAEPLLTPAEVAAMFRVDPKTVTRWAKAGKLTSIRTLGGHRRYRESEVRALLNGQGPMMERVEVGEF